MITIEMHHTFEIGDTERCVVDGDAYYLHWLDAQRLILIDNNSSPPTCVEEPQILHVETNDDRVTIYCNNPDVEEDMKARAIARTVEAHAASPGEAFHQSFIPANDAVALLTRMAQEGGVYATDAIAMLADAGHARGDGGVSDQRKARIGRWRRDVTRTEVGYWIQTWNWVFDPSLPKPPLNEVTA
jgi:hypothetical protein